VNQLFWKDFFAEKDDLNYDKVEKIDILFSTLRILTIETMELPQKQLFEEFIQYAFNEMNIPGWRDRMNELRGFESGYFNDYRHAPIGKKTQHLDYRARMTIPELVEENGHFEETMMNIFKNDLYEYHWFKAWFEYHYNEIYISMSDSEQYDLGNGHSEIGWDLNEFIKGLTFEKMMEIIDSQISLK